MESAHGSDDVGAARAQPRKLEGSFHRFGSRVAQEGPLKFRWGDADQLDEEHCPLVVVKAIGASDKPLGLFGHGFYNDWIGMADVGHAVTANTVDILFAVGIPDSCAFASYQHQGLLGVQAAAI
jgi:hypothetical protein